MIKPVLCFSILFLFSITAYAAECDVPKTSFTSKEITDSPDRVISLPGLGCVKDLELAGSLPVINSEKLTAAAREKSANLFYWFVENRQHSDSAPIVLWLNGGPGAASMYGFFMENGPYSVDKKGQLHERTNAWTNKANYLVIDQPAGVGLSYGVKDVYVNEAQAMDQLYFALQTFFQRYPELAKKELYIAGESYAGKYIPQLAVRILNGNKSKQTIKLKGILIGDGWVNPRMQQSANADYSYSHGLIDQITYKKVLKLYRQCVKEIDKATPSTRRANKVCGEMQDTIQKASGIDLANIRTAKQSDDSDMIHYLNQTDVRNALHVDARVGEFKTFSKMTSDILEVGEQDSVADLYPKILNKGVRVLLYNGLEDAKDSNFLSTDKWLAALNWSKKNKFLNAPTCIWRVNDRVAGYAKSASGLTQLKIRGAGHLAPIDQPEILLALFNQFAAEKSFCSK